MGCQLGKRERPRNMTKRELVAWLWLGSRSAPGPSYAEGGCWIPPLKPKPSGYTQVVFQGENRQAHCLVWEVENGMLVPDGLIVRHRCDNPPCIHPDHLVIGTHQDNSDDQAERDRKLRGESAPSAKLTRKQVRAIRRKYSTGHWTQKDLALRYGVSRAAVYYIVNGKNWKEA